VERIDDGDWQEMLIPWESIVKIVAFEIPLTGVGIDIYTDSIGGSSNNRVYAHDGILGFFDLLSKLAKRFPERVAVTDDDDLKSLESRVIRKGPFIVYEREKACTK
jgi:hypothetical protein